MMKHFTLALMIFCLFSSFTAQNAEAKKPGRRDITVLSFNVRTSLANKKDGDNNWVNRREAAIRMLRDQNPDIFGIQEGQYDQVSYLAANLPEYEYVGVGRDDGNDKGERCCIFYKKSRLELVDHGDFWLSETPDVVSKSWDAGYHRICTWTRVRDLRTGKEFCLFNTHIDLKPIAKIEGMKVFAERAKAISGNTPSILTADWNMMLGHEGFKVLEGEYKDLRTSLKKVDENITYNAFGKREGRIIDMFWYKGLKPVSYKVVNDGYGVPYVSDHYPILGIFRF